LIERLYLRDLVIFDEVELEFNKGLVVLTGPSGAGKSVLMSAILSSFGHVTQGAAALCELNLLKPTTLESEAYSFKDELTIKTLKKEKLRYFVDGQNISKKALAELFSPYVKYLSVRDKGGFTSSSLLVMIDNSLIQKDKSFKKLLKEYKKRYIHYKSKIAQLEKLKDDEKKLAQHIEFAKYEIDKIERINPKVNEEVELMRVKQQLSRIDKIRDAMGVATEIFSYERSVEEVYRLLDKESATFTEMMNQLRADFEETSILADELEEINVEEVLDRLSDLTTLKNQYGSLEEAIAYKEAKKIELLGFENIEEDKSMLESFIDLEFTELTVLSSRLSKVRKKEALVLEKALEEYLEMLKLPVLEFVFSHASLDDNGLDNISILLGDSAMSTLSGGEFNRVRLALMTTTLKENSKSQGVLILDEIDANVSGDESIAIAKMIAKLSSVYQIFSISHQPHLSALANQHILVTKEGKSSRVEVLTNEGRVHEIARIIGGENPTLQAVEFAKKLRS